MKRWLLLSLLLVAPASAQTPPAAPPDPGMTTCKQLLGEANDRVIQLGAGGAAMQKQIEALQKEIVALRAEKKPADVQADGKPRPPDQPLNKP